MQKGQPTKHRGVYLLPTGEYLVRAQVKDPRTGKYLDRSQKLPRIDSGTGQPRTLEGAHAKQVELQISSSRIAPEPAARRRFSEFAAAEIQFRNDTKKINSNATRDKYMYAMRHINNRWGSYYLDAITRDEVKKWNGELGRLVIEGKYSPNSVNDYWVLFKSLMGVAAADYNLADPTAKLSQISTDGHRTYTLAEPNSLTPDELPDFFRAARLHARDHFAFLFLGTLTGRRASELRPLRAKGDDIDVAWQAMGPIQKGTLQVRRSQTIGAPMEMTKQKKDVFAFMPQSLLEVLEEHMEDLKGKRALSDLLFPPFRKKNGTPSDALYLGPGALRKALPLICEKAKIKKALTGRAMRRTYQDLCRAAEVSQTIQMAMSGHATAKMKEWYSTMGGDEGRESLTRMASVAGVLEAARL